MKFIEIELKGEKSHYINVSSISFIHNNNGFADIYITALDTPIQTRLKYDDVLKLIINTPNF